MGRIDAADPLRSYFRILIQPGVFRITPCMHMCPYKRIGIKHIAAITLTVDHKLRRISPDHQGFRIRELLRLHSLSRFQPDPLSFLRNAERFFNFLTRSTGDIFRGYFGDEVLRKPRIIRRQSGHAVEILSGKILRSHIGPGPYGETAVSCGFHHLFAVHDKHRIIGSVPAVNIPVQGIDGRFFSGLLGNLFIIIELRHIIQHFSRYRNAEHTDRYLGILLVDFIQNRFVERNRKHLVPGIARIGHCFEHRNDFRIYTLDFRIMNNILPLKGFIILPQRRNRIRILFFLPVEFSIPGILQGNLIFTEDGFPVERNTLNLLKRPALCQNVHSLFRCFLYIQKPAHRLIMQDEEFSVRTQLNVILDGVRAFLIRPHRGFDRILRIYGRIAAMSDHKRNSEKTRRRIMEKLLGLDSSRRIFDQHAVDPVCIVRQKAFHIAAAFHPDRGCEPLQEPHGFPVCGLLRQKDHLSMGSVYGCDHIEQCLAVRAVLTAVIKHSPYVKQIRDLFDKFSVLRLRYHKTVKHPGFRQPGFQSRRRFGIFYVKRRNHLFRKAGYKAVHILGKKNAAAVIDMQGGIQPYKHGGRPLFTFHHRFQIFIRRPGNGRCHHKRGLQFIHRCIGNRNPRDHFLFPFPAARAEALLQSLFLLRRLLDDIPFPPHVFIRIRRSFPHPYMFRIDGTYIGNGSGIRTGGIDPFLLFLIPGMRGSPGKCEDDPVRIAADSFKFNGFIDLIIAEKDFRIFIKAVPFLCLQGKKPLIYLPAFHRPEVRFIVLRMERIKRNNPGIGFREAYILLIGFHIQSALFFDVVSAEKRIQ